jgi:hypothetical protein
MMGEKIFMEKDKLTLRGDDRDIMLPVQYKMAVLRWCRRNKIDFEFPLSKDQQDIVKHYFGVNIWRVRDEQQRMWFMFRWS